MQAPAGGDQGQPQQPGDGAPCSPAWWQAHTQSQPRHQQLSQTLCGKPEILHLRFFSIEHFKPGPILHDKTPQILSYNPDNNAPAYIQNVRLNYRHCQPLSQEQILKTTLSYSYITMLLPSALLKKLKPSELCLVWTSTLIFSLKK